MGFILWRDGIKMKLQYTLAVVGALAGSAALAEDGLYYGGAVGVADVSSRSQFGAPSGKDLSFGAVVGYKSSLSNGGFWAAEVTVDLLTGGTLEYPFGAQACTNQSPDWCEVKTLARLRGVYGVPISDTKNIIYSAGIAYVEGRGEDGPFNYLHTTSTGFTLGIGLERESGKGTMRYEAVYDRFEGANPDDFDKTLEIVSLRLSYLF